MYFRDAEQGRQVSRLHNSASGLSRMSSTTVSTVSFPLIRKHKASPMVKSVINPLRRNEYSTELNAIEQLDEQSSAWSTTLPSAINTFATGRGPSFQ
jgi:hypothetical protein